TTKVIGQALALAGVVWALFDRDTGSQGSVTGDLLALGGAVGWAAIALLTKVSPFARETPEAQLGWQLVVSATILLPVCLLFGPLVRDFTPIYGVGVAVQTAIVAGAFLGWFGLMKIYPASSVASFAFLAPVFGVVSGWLILGEEISVAVWGALILVALGLILINRPARR
ncbi:MAG: DMT family transporter, partial [Pseudomonadota bacterium]